jgi:hypothetical protein
VTTDSTVTSKPNEVTLHVLMYKCLLSLSRCLQQILMIFLASTTVEIRSVVQMWNMRTDGKTKRQTDAFPSCVHFMQLVERADKKNEPTWLHMQRKPSPNCDQNTVILFFLLTFSKKVASWTYFLSTNSPLYIVTRRGVFVWLIRWVLDWMIGFIATYTFTILDCM